MSVPTSGESEWIRPLIEFLSQEPGVEAVRINVPAQELAVATLGSIDLKRLEASLGAAIAEIGTRFPAGRRVHRLPRGFELKSDEKGGTVLQKESCATAPGFWRWREFSWPEAAEVERKEPEWKSLMALAVGCGTLGATAFVLDRATGLPESWSRGLYALAIVLGGWDAARDSIPKLRQAELDIHFLMLAVATGAVAIGAWGEAVLLLFLFSFSGALEEFAMHRTHREVESLLKAAPKQALLLEADGSQRLIPAGRIQLGDRLLVKPGEIFPVDGEIVRGKTASDEATLTGEAKPVEKGEGDPVFSGTLNLWGAVELTVHRLASESTLQKIIRLIQTAQKLRAPSERFTDRFGASYTLGVLGLTAGMYFVWWLGFELPAFTNTAETTSAFYRAMTLLVVASPCALVLSIPSAILAAIAWGARHGVLFRGGAAIEKLAEVDLVAMDKTGTLTTGELTVLTVESFPPGREQDVLELAYAIERNSEHPIARAITEHGRRLGLGVRPISDFQAITGQGVRARAGEASCVLGRRELMEEGTLAEWIRQVPAPAPEFSEIWVLAQDLIGRILLRDEVRLESKSVLRQLKEMGIRTVMLTGDRRHTAEAVAKDLGVEEVLAGLSPEGKVNAIDGFGKEGFKVAMVGDGVNDAPSLAAAFVSVAMGARGSDAALEQSEVVLMRDRIENFLAARRLSLRARRIIRQNLVVALGTVAVMVTAALIGTIPLSLGVFAHEGSTVVVCLNSLRLLFGKDRAAPAVQPAAIGADSISTIVPGSTVS